MDDPIQQRENEMQIALRGDLEGVSAEQAAAGLRDAEEYMEGGYAGRSLGFGLIRAKPLYEGGDWQELLVAVTDGQRAGAVIVRVSGTQAAALGNENDRVIEYALERLDGIAGAFPNDGHRYENFLVQHPISV